MGKRFNVYGVGNALVDLQLQVTEAELESFGCGGELKATMRLVELDEQRKLIDSIQGRSPKRCSGGSVCNTTIALSQLGGRAALACRVGQDSLGEFYLQEMRELGVTIHSAPKPPLPTGTCAVLITPDAERTMRTYLGSSAQFSADDIDEDTLKDSEYIFIEGYLFAQEGGRAGIARAVDLALKHQVKIAVTVSEAFIVEFFGDPLREVIKHTDLLFANAAEGKRLAGVEDEEEAFSRLKQLVPNLAFTRSSEGAWGVLNGKEARVPAYKVKAVDDTGAGDMFAAGFLYGATHGLDAERSIQTGSFLASRVVSQLGARIPGDLRKLLGEGGLL